MLLEDSDLPVPFRQRRYFYYLSGVDEPSCHLLYNIEKDVLTLFIPKFDARQAMWYGRGLNREETRQKYDVDKVKWANKLSKKIEKAWKKTKGKVYILHPSHAPPGYKNNDPRINFSSLQDAIDRCRVIKDPHEIKLIRKANEISAKAHSAVLASILDFKNEADVEATFKEISISHGAKRQAYQVIAASGTNAAVLHYAKNDESLAGRQLLVLDAGAEYSCYASDVTRTIPLGIPSSGGVGKWPSKEAAEIYSLVLKMQLECIRRLKPGVAFRDLHVLAHAILIRGFLKLGIFNGPEEDIMKLGVSAAFFPHGLGHHLGLEVHDVIGVPIWLQKSLPLVDLSTCEGSESLFTEAGFPYLCDASNTSVINNIKTFAVDPPAPARGLLEGMVITVEPGIYFNAYTLEKVYLPSPIHSKYINKEVLKRYMPVGGVRIEDDILITHVGYENLTTATKVATTDKFDANSSPHDPRSDMLRNAFGSKGQQSSAILPTKSTALTQQTEDKIWAPMKVNVLPELNESNSQERTLQEKFNELEAKYNALLQEKEDLVKEQSAKPNADPCSCRHGQLDAKFKSLMEKFKLLPQQSSGTDWMCADEFYDAFLAIKSSLPQKWRSGFDTYGSKKSLCDVVCEEMEMLYNRMEERYKKMQSTLESAPEQKTLSPSPRKRAAETTLPIRTRDVKRGKTLFDEWKVGREDRVSEERGEDATLWQNSVFQTASDRSMDVPNSTVGRQSCFNGSSNATEDMKEGLATAPKVPGAPPHSAQFLFLEDHGKNARKDASPNRLRRAIPDEEKKLYEDGAKPEREQLVTETTEFKAHAAKKVITPPASLSNRSPFMLFADLHRDKVWEQNPGKFFTEIAKILGEMWKALSDEERKPFEDRAAKDLEKSKAEMAAYDALIQKSTTAPAPFTTKPSIPNRELSAYMFFANSRRDKVREQNPRNNFAEVDQVLTEMWKALSNEERKRYEDRTVEERERYEANKKDSAYGCADQLQAKSELPPKLGLPAILPVEPPSVPVGPLPLQKSSKPSSGDSKRHNSLPVMVKAPCKLHGQSFCGCSGGDKCDLVEQVCRLLCGPPPHRISNDIPPPPGIMSTGAIPPLPNGVALPPAPVFAPPPPPGIPINSIPFYTPFPQPLPRLSGYPPPFSPPPSMHLGPIPPPQLPPPIAPVPTDEDSWDVMGCNDCSARGMKCELDHFNNVKSPQHSLYPHPPIRAPHIPTQRQTRPNINNPAPLGHRTNPAPPAQPINPFSWQIPPAPLPSSLPSQPRPEMFGRLTSPFPMPSAVAKPSINGKLPSLKEGFNLRDTKPKSLDSLPRVERPWVQRDLAESGERWLRAGRMWPGGGVNEGKRNGTGESCAGPRVPEKPEAYRWSVG